MANNVQFDAIWNPEAGKLSWRDKDGKEAKHSLIEKRADGLFDKEEMERHYTAEEMQWLETAKQVGLRKVGKDMPTVDPCPFPEKAIVEAFEDKSTKRVLIKGSDDLLRPSIPISWFETFLATIEGWNEVTFIIKTANADRLSGLELPKNLVVKAKAGKNKSAFSRKDGERGSDNDTPVDEPSGVASLSEKPGAEEIKEQEENRPMPVMQITEIPVDAIDRGPRLRTLVKKGLSFEALKQDIAQNGLMQPIVVVSDDQDRYRLVAGGRRLEVFKDLGMVTIPAIVYASSTTEERRFMAELLENAVREDLNPIDQATAYLKLYKRIAKKDDDEEKVEIAAKKLRSTLQKYERNRLKQAAEKEAIQIMIDTVGKTARTIENVLSLLRLPNKDLREAIAKEEIDVTVGYVLAAKMKHKNFNSVVEKVLKGCSGREGASQKMTVCEVQKEFREEPTPSSLFKSLENSLNKLQKNIDESVNLDSDDAKKLLQKLEQIVETMKEKTTLRVAS